MSYSLMRKERELTHTFTQRYLCGAKDDNALPEPEGPGKGYLFSSSQLAMITSAPGVRFRSFSAIRAFSETVAFASLRAKILIFLRRCRRRLNSFLRSMQGTTQSSEDI